MAAGRKRGHRAKGALATEVVFHKVLQEILAQTRAEGFKKFLKELLLELCQVNTTPNPAVAKMGAAEDACFRILERELRGFTHTGAKLERRAINPGIAAHANFSLLHFTKTATRPEGLRAEEAYAGRSNLVYLVPGTTGNAGGRSVAVNAHVDVVAPYFAPSTRGSVVFGRGACDDKGPVVGIVAALKVLSVHGDTELVTVKDSENTVRIWVDSKNVAD